MIPTSNKLFRPPVSTSCFPFASVSGDLNTPRFLSFSSSIKSLSPPISPSNQEEKLLDTMSVNEADLDYSIPPHVEKLKNAAIWMLK